MPKRVSVVEAAVHLRTSVDGVLERVATGDLVCAEDDDGRLWVVLPDCDSAADAEPPRLASVAPDPTADTHPDRAGEAFRSRLQDLHARHLTEMAELQARHQAEREHAWETYRQEKERLLAANRAFGGRLTQSTGR